MAYFYMDTDGAGATAPYDTWAKAAQDLETALGAMSAGDTLYIQGVATDTAAATRTYTVPGTIGNPCRIIGVKDGTTNTGTSVVVSDLLIRGTDTLVKIEASGAVSDVIFDSGFAFWHGIHFAIGDQINTVGKAFKHLLNDCKITLPDDIILNGGAMEMVWVNCEYEPLGAGVDIRCIGGCSLAIYGGSLAATASPTNIFRNDSFNVSFTGFDLTNLGNNSIISPIAMHGIIKFTNCKTPATFTEMGSTPTGSKGAVIMIGCNDGSSKALTTSYQDYYYGDVYGEIRNEATIIRTGGADDGATGGFSYAMTPNVDATLESSCNTLKSPWLNVWLTGGANTITVYICNDSTSTDYNEDEVWCEFYTPDAGDTAQHDLTFEPANERILDSTTIITDDTGSAWGTGGNNHQKMSITVTTGFEGEGYVRVHLAKRYAATPDTLYVDALPEVS